MWGVMVQLSHFKLGYALLIHSVGHNEVIGVCHVGNRAQSLGRDHWNEMLTYPRKPIARWHPLVEVMLNLPLALYFNFNRMICFLRSVWRPRFTNSLLITFADVLRSSESIFKFTLGSRAVCSEYSSR